MKTFILTIDYELFLGNETGTVEKCMIEPTFRLCDLLELNNSGMTVFWDILHYYKLRQLENDFPVLRNDRLLVDDQISFLISKGYDIQLHIHPHWLDASYTNGKWNFSYDRFNIHSLSKEDNKNDINTITGCITAGKKLMEEVIKKYYSEYCVTTYRAGGYLIEPFDELKKAFESNGIYIDSSTLPGMYRNDVNNSYRFDNYPDNIFYRFENSPSEVSDKGKFIEIPVKTIKIPVIRNLMFKLIRILRYPALEKERAGTGSGLKTESYKKSLFAKLFSLVSKPLYRELSTDNNFSERFNYMCSKVKSNSTMILHPKLLNSHTFDIIRNKLSGNEIKFISIKDFVRGRL